MYYFYRKSNWGHGICPLCGGCPPFGDSVIRGFTVIQDSVRIVQCLFYIIIMFVLIAIVLTCFAIQIITKLERQEEEPWPVERVSHAACCLGFGTQHPHLLVTGGVDNDDKTLGDAWLFDVNNRKWKEVS